MIIRITLQGNGFQYKNGNNLLFEGALMFGTSSSTVEDVARDASDGGAQDNSFNIVQPLKLLISGGFILPAWHYYI